MLVFLPGIPLQVLAVGVWAIAESSAGGWLTAGLTLVIAIAVTVLKYLRPGRRLRAAGISNRLMFAAVLVGTVGLFVLPVVGAPLGFVTTIYIFERRRKGKSAAWPSTKAALRAIVASVGIELAGAFSILILFVTAVLVT